VALQKTHVASISKHVVTVREGFSRLGALSNLPPLSLVDLLHATSGGFGS
jgi:hypothetical protein